MPPIHVEAPPVFHRSPGQVLFAGAGHAVIDGLAILVVAVAHMALDRRTAPHEVARHRIARFDPAHDAEFTARHARQQQAFGDQRRGRHRIAGRIIVDFLFPDDLARVLVQRHEIGVQRAEDHQVAEQGRAAVDHVAAGHDAVRQTVLIFPQLGARFQVDGEDARIRCRDEHLAVVNQRLRFLAPLLFAAKRERPGRHQLGHGLVIDLRQRRIALALRAHAERQDAGRVLGRAVEHGTGDIAHVGRLDQRCRRYQTQTDDVSP